MNLTAAPAILAHTLTEGGATIDAATLAPAALEDGFMVGGAAAEIIVPVDAEADFFKALETMYATQVKYIGTWVHEGRIYIDGSEWFPTLSSALETARSRNEIAIWDLKEQSEITC